MDTRTQPNIHEYSRNGNATQWTHKIYDSRQLPASDKLRQMEVYDMTNSVRWLWKHPIKCNFIHEFAKSHDL